MSFMDHPNHGAEEPPSYAAASSSSSHTSDLTSSYASIYMQGRDKLRFLNLPEALVLALEPLLVGYWPKGIQEKGPVEDCYSFKFEGYPFGTSGSSEGVSSRMMIKAMLSYLYERGWYLVTPISTSHVVGCKDSMIFRQRKMRAPNGFVEPEVEKLPAVDWLIVCIGGNDKLRLIGEAQQPGLLRAVQSLLEGMQMYQGGEMSDGSFEFKLKGWPWYCFSEKRVKSELLILRLVELFDNWGWRTYGTIRTRTETDKAKKADTWYLVKSQDWQRPNTASAEDVPRPPEKK